MAVVGLTGFSDSASADIVVDDLIVPRLQNGRSLVGGKVSGSPSGFFALEMSIGGRRSSWSGMRDEYIWRYQSTDLGQYRKRAQCATPGTYRRSSTFRISGYVAGGTSMSGGGYGASVSGPVSASMSFNSAGADLTCTLGGVEVVA